jgi:cytoskeleton protein RodZ
LQTVFQDSGLNRDEPANDMEPDPEVHGDQTDVGSILRRTRVQSGYTLDQVSQNLNIRLQHIAAIEESRFDELPGLTYALGFVKAYANFLGLDDHAVAARYKEEIQIVPGGQRLVFPEPVDEARVPKGTLIAVSLAAALAIYGVWYFVSSYNSVKMVTVPPVPDRLAPDSVGPKSILPAAVPSQTAEAAPDSGASKPEAAKAEPTKTEPAKTEPAKPEVAKAEPPKIEKPVPAKVAAAQPPATADADNAEEDSELPTPPVDTIGPDGTRQEVATVEPPAEAAAQAPAPDATATDQPVAPVAEAPHVPKVYGSQDGDVRVVIKADTDSWVEVDGPGNDVILSRVLQAGDTYRVPNREGLTMMTGNAGALEILVDGQSIGSLGPLGAVRRGVDLAPQALEARNTAVTN